MNLPLRASLAGLSLAFLLGGCSVGDSGLGSQGLFDAQSNDSAASTDSGTTPLDSSGDSAVSTDSGAIVDSSTPTDVGTDQGVDAACTAPRQICGSTCVDVTTDPANCGGCGTTCGATQACVSNGSGGFACGCAAGKKDCGGTCIDTTGDPNNCGDCGHKCDTFGVCVTSICGCPGTTQDCSGTCTDLSADPSACGQCTASACNNDSYCAPITGTPATGACTGRPGLTFCDGATPLQWVDLQGDATNCGVCGTTCDAASKCVSGHCVAKATACQSGRGTCANGAASGTSCFDLQNDATHCGMCGKGGICKPNEVCAKGACHQYAVAVGCTTSSCDCTKFVSASSSTQCPALPGQTYAICVAGADCPGPI